MKLISFFRGLSYISPPPYKKNFFCFAVWNKKRNFAGVVRENGLRTVKLDIR